MAKTAGSKGRGGQRRRRLFISLSASLLLLFAVHWGLALVTGYSRAMQSGRTNIREVTQFDHLFPNSEQSLSHYVSGDPTWNATAGLHQRYVLTMQVPVTLGGFGRGKIVAAREPTFYLSEVRRVETLSDGRTTITYGGTELTFGRAEWSKLVESNGDLSVLGAEIKTGEPVPGFVAR